MHSKSYHFTKGKWLQLSSVQQHKKLAELLRHLYAQTLNKQLLGSEFEHYQQLLRWSALPNLLSKACYALADRYHEHMQHANQQLKEHNLLPQVENGDKEQREAILPISVYLDHLRSAHNIGSILRTAEAFGLAEVIYSPNMATSDHKQVKDASMGTWEWIPSRVEPDLSTLPSPLIAIETCENALPLFDFPFPESCTVVLGNEEYGCSPEVLKAADSFIKIPLLGRKNSLNVANAFAVVAGEIVRQKKVWEDGKPDSVGCPK